VLVAPGLQVEWKQYGPINRGVFESAAFALYFVGEMKAIRPLYGEWSRDFCMLEAGLMAQLLEMRAAGCGMGLCQIGGLEFEPLRQGLGLEKSQVYLHGMVGGRVEGAQTGLKGLVEESQELRVLLGLLQEQGESGEKGEPKVVGEGRRKGSGDDEVEVEEEEGRRTVELQEFLRKKLPEYMVPGVFVYMKELPLSGNGKVDRRALPLPEAGGGEGRKGEMFVAAETELEEKLAGIWEEVLQVEKVGVEDNFFDLGGTSVHLVRVHARLRALLAEEVPIVKMFEYPTIRALIGYSRRQGEDGAAVLQESQEHAQARKALRQQRQQRRQQARQTEAVN
jgi:aryl carrier-like protein